MQRTGRCKWLVALLFLMVVSGGVVAQDAPPPTPDESAPGVVIHVVQRGENLFRIALNYGLTVDEIAAANGITNPASIIVGQRLIIPLNVPEPPPEPLTHVVTAGESLESIAALYGVTTETLALLNGIANPNAIFVGQVLTIREAGDATEPSPVPEAVAAPPTVEAAPPPEEAATESTDVVHIVAAGETLFRIATNYGVTVADLQTANGIADPTLIYAGQEIIIPGVAPPPLALDLPPSITAVDLSPQLFTEGRTARIRVTTAVDTTVAIDFLGTQPPVIAESSTSHVALLVVPLGTTPEIYPLNLTITPSDGSPADPLALNVQIVGGGYGSQMITLPGDRAALVNIGIEQNETSILNGVMPFNPERYFAGPMSLPAAAPMNAPYGAVRAYNGGPFDRYHTGADFAGAPGSPVLAAAPGRVVLADALVIRGQTVVIDHGWGVYTTYAHMRERLVNLGDVVETGQTIGLIGSTGRATGAHLHWEVWVNGVPVEPMQWVRQAFP